MAGIRVTVGVKGAAFARAKLSRRAAEKATRAMFAELLKGALLIEGRARRRAPVDLGQLRASLTHSGLLPRGDALVVAIGTNDRKAPFVEFGTGPLGRRSKLTETAREAMRELGYEHGPRGGFPPVDLIGAWAKRRGITKGMDDDEAESVAFAIARAIRAHGTPAQPFLFPAFEESRKEIERGIGAAVRAEVER